MLKAYWVSNYWPKPDARNKPVFIAKKEGGVYKEIDGKGWLFATPILEGEVPAGDDNGC